MKEWMQKIITAVMAISMLSVTCIGALSQPAEAFSVFGLQVGGGQQPHDTAPREHNPAPDEPPQEEDARDIENDSVHGLNRASQEAPEEADRGLERARERANVHAMIQFANQDKYTRTALKDFDGDRFCVETGERVAYVQVNDDGSIELLNEKPDDCYEVSTSEDFVARAWDQAQSGTLPQKEEFKENVNMPWGLKMKLFMNNMFS